MFGWAGWCRRYARKFAESPEDFYESPRTSGESERKPAEDDRIFIEAKSAPRTGVALGRDGLLSEQMRGDFAEVPHDPQPGHDLQRVVSDVDLPPEETLARRGHKVMMVVVPAFAEREQREQPVILAGVTGFIAPRAEKVRERIDGEGIVPEKHR